MIRIHPSRTQTLLPTKGGWGNFFLGGKGMKTLSHLSYWGVILIIVLSAILVPHETVRAAGSINLITMGAAYTQDFDSLASSGTSAVLPVGWDLLETGSGANAAYTAGAGSASAGNIYSFGAESSPERALGGLRSTALVPVFGASFTNNTGSVMTSLVIAYTGEEWRLGTAGRADQLIFEYSTNATGLASGTWLRVPALDFTTPDLAPSGPKDGNAAGARRMLSARIDGLNIPNGTTFWIRWLDPDAPGADDGLAIDDFSLIPQIDLSIGDAAGKEGRSGITTFAFTVSLSAPAPAGGVTFDITTADDSAAAVDGDYVPSQLTGQAIPAGSSTYIFNVSVNGDTIPETDETFLVHVTNVTGAAVMDGQGRGTINNDDTATTLASSSSPAGYGTLVIFTATVSQPGAGTPTGIVEFFDGTSSLGTSALETGGQARFSTSALTSGSHTITAVYGGDANFDGSASAGITQIIEAPPGVERIDSLPNTGDGQVVENERVNVAITQLLVVFNKAMQAANPADPNDVLNPLNYSLTRDGSVVIPINSVAYAAQTATLSLNGGAVLPDGRYTLTVSGNLRDTLGTPLGVNFVRTFFVDRSAPRVTGIVTLPDNRPLTNGSSQNVRFSKIEITFSEDIYDPGDSIAQEDVTNPSNYVLVTPGLDGVFDKVSCAPGLAGGDVQIFAGPVTYNNHGGAGPFVATIQLNGGAALPNGRYRLFLCGSTSIVDLAGNALNNGVDESVTFTVLVTSQQIPQTGFAPGVVTSLPEQPAEKAYTDLGNLWIEIPRLNLKIGITGVPLTAQGWDVTWLNRQVGWLEGTAYPTWEGNTVLTAHGYTADGEAGPFAALKDLSYGDTVVIHLGGMKYTYGIRTNLLINPSDTHWLAQHETLDWVTLITCQQYDAKTSSYRYRRVVRAVLIKVEEE